MKCPKPKNTKRNFKLKKERKKMLEELRHAIRHQSKIKNQEMMEKLNTMIKKWQQHCKKMGSTEKVPTHSQ